MNLKYRKKTGYSINVILFFIIILSLFLPNLSYIKTPSEISSEKLITGKNLLSIGLYKPAISYFSDAIAYQSTNYEAYLYRAFAYITLDDIENAKKDLFYVENQETDQLLYYSIKAQIMAYEYEGLSDQEILEYENILSKLILLDPENLDFILWRGTFYFENKMFEKTIEDLLSISSNATALYYLGSSYFELKEYEATIFYLEKALSIGSGNSALYQQLAIANYELNQFEAAIKYQNLYIENSVQDGIMYKDLGLMNFLNKDLKLAKENYEKALLMIPDDEEIIFQLGIIYYNIGNFDEAISKFSLSIDQNNQWSDAYINRAYCYIAQENYYLAYEDLIIANELNAGNLNIVEKLAEISLILGKYEESINHYADLISNDTENISYLFTHAYLVSTYQIDNCQDISWEFQKVLEIDPSRVNIHHLLGLCSYYSDEVDQAKVFWENAIEYLPENLDSLYFLALIAYDDNDYSSAYNYLTKFLSFKPNHGMANHIFGNVLLEMEFYEESISHFNLAIENNVEVVISYFNRGVANFNLGKIQEAEKDFLMAKSFAEEVNDVIIIEIINNTLEALYDKPY